MNEKEKEETAIRTKNRQRDSCVRQVRDKGIFNDGRKKI
tara:strand:+ start:112 stop:228 length:117 start_codon:yes stop_codon:yes gene_type:complete